MGKIIVTLFPFTDIPSGMKPSAATFSVLQRHPGSALFLRKVPKMPCFCGFYGVGSNEPNDEPSGFKRRGKLNCINAVVITQKCFTTDFLTKKRKVNEGEVPQYYIENSHEAIIDPLEWDAVQDEIKRRKAIGRSYSCNSIFSAKLKCDDCGGWYAPKTWHSTDKYRSVVWRCNQKYNEGKCRCQTPAIRETEIQYRFIQVFNSLIKSKEPYLAACETAKGVLMDTTTLDTEINELNREMEIVSELTRKCIETNSSHVQDQEEYTERYNGYVERYEKAKNRYDTLVAERHDRLKKAKAIDRFMQTVASREVLLAEFDPQLWLITVDYVTVMKNCDLRFRFFDGTEVVV